MTPPDLTPWSKVSQLDASHFDDDTVYAAINRFRLDDQHPHIYRTHDGGATWKEIVRGLPDGPVNTVREDPVRKGLLFAGTELAVYVSFNDGDDWHPLRLNMPATSIRDLVIHEDDVVVGTHGRGFWILDDISPLRQLTAQVAAADAHLFAPRRRLPLPAQHQYRYAAAARRAGGPESAGWRDSLLLVEIRRRPARSRSKSTTAPIAWCAVSPATTSPSRRPPAQCPDLLAAGLPAAIGRSRHASLRLGSARPAARSGGRGEPPISAIVHDTPVREGEWMPPGRYTVKLTVNGRTYTQPLLVKPDPR